jgi:serine/threonine-protein kinase
MKEKEGRITLWRLDLEAATEPVEISPTISASEEQPALSPDGRWLAFASDELGSEEILVRPFPGGGQRQQVSLNGGLDPFWSRTGDALFYWENEVLMEVPVKGGTAFTPGTARRLFSAAVIGLDPLANSPKAAIDVSPDGRFLIARRSREDPRRGLLLVENWFEEYRKR